MKTILEHEPAGDSELVALCLQGDRGAFAQIVARYQSVVCAIAYSGCGDLGRSEDVAQETFITAWRKLGDLKEPERLKSWLCGIARNLFHHSVRQQQRTPTSAAEPLTPETPAGTETPSDQVISKEEESMLWRALEGIPEIYREPMILFYRESQSTQAVAAALDLSEELVRKRLSRGREMLSERIAKMIETTLLKSSPGKAFTIGVLAALPAFTLSAKAATVGAVAAKGGVAAKAAGPAVLFPAILGPFLSILTPYIDYRLNLEDARSPEERQFVVQFFRILMGCIVVFIAATWLLAEFGSPLAQRRPAIYTGLWIGLSAIYLVAIVMLARWSRRRQGVMRETQQAAPREPAFEYESKCRLLGLPLIHIRIRGGLERGPVKAWFAAGDAAIGVIFAFGGIAVAPVSFGGFAVGLLTFGGLAAGVVSFGGFSFGAWAIGGMAIGWQTFGGCAVGWLAAQGGVAIAHEFAQGGVIALAAHANDGAAEAFFKDSRFFQNVSALMLYANWVYLIFLFPLALWWRAKRKKQLARNLAAR